MLKTAVLFGGLLAVLAGPVRAGTNDLISSLQKGLFEEEANHNLPAAIAAYQSAIAHFDKDRRVAATAVFRLGECYRKLGNTSEATVQYERIVREFPDQAPLVELSRQHLPAQLAGGGGQPATEEQKRLLVQEITLAEQNLALHQSRFKTGVENQDSVFEAKRQLLELKRSLAALEAGQPAPPAATPAGTPPRDRSRPPPRKRKKSPASRRWSGTARIWSTPCRMTSATVARRH